MPSFDALHAAVDRAADRARARGIERDRRNTPAGPSAFIPRLAVNDPFARLCLEVMRQREAADLMPFECARIVLPLVGDVSIGQQVRELHDGFVDDGRWDGYAGRTASQFPPRGAVLLVNTARYEREGEYWNTPTAIAAAAVAAFDRPLPVHVERNERGMVAVAEEQQLELEQQSITQGGFA